jgi:hypothetical protein
MGFKFGLANILALMIGGKFCSWGCTPNPRYFLFQDKKYPKNSRLMMILLQSTVPVFGAQSKPLRCASFLDCLLNPTRKQSP